jgi:hypothetical protein
MNKKDNQLENKRKIMLKDEKNHKEHQKWRKAIDMI